MLELISTILLFIKEWLYMRIFKTMIPIYGWQVLNGNYVLTKEEATDGQKVVPERYVPFVAEWLTAREDKRKED
jgi:hypothetical protein|nr:MAG TPA: hypothetical protein [Caudoviricetes sp.]